MKSTLIAIYFDCPFAAGSRHSDRAIRRMCVNQRPTGILPYSD
jgi:hypothetical protein